MSFGRTMIALAAWLVLGAPGCKSSEPAPADPQLPALLGADAVDGSLTRMIAAERRPASFDEGAPSKGAAQPLVTIVEYSDFECPFCGGFATTLDELLHAYPDDVRIVFQQFPLAMHPGAELAARASIAAQNQGRFWAMHDRLFRERHGEGRERMIELAEELGLDPVRFAADLDAPATAQRVAAEQAHGRELGVQSTPNFFINGRPVAGALPPDRLQKLVEAERKAALQLIDAGSKREEIYARYLRAALDQHRGAASPGSGP